MPRRLDATLGTALVAAAFLLIAAGQVHARGTVHLVTPGPDPLDTADAVFEATIVAVTPGKGDEPGTVSLLVTSDWRRVFAGHRLLATTIDVPFRGAELLAAIRRASAAPGSRWLFAIDGAGGELAMIAHHLGTRYLLAARAPVDPSKRSGAQTTIYEGSGPTFYVLSGMPSGQHDEATLRARFRDERRRFLDGIARLPGVEPEALDEASVVGLIARLDAPDFAIRDDAQRRLIERGGAHLPAIRLAAERAASMESRRRLARVAHEIEWRGALWRGRGEIARRGSSLAAERKELGPEQPAQLTFTFKSSARLEVIVPR